MPEERVAHSLHAYFLLPGDPSVPIIYEVERLRDGGSFTTRRVKGIQHGKAMFSMSVSFQKAEPGPNDGQRGSGGVVVSRMTGTSCATSATSSSSA